MFCGKCGKKIKKGTVNCKKCGTLLVLEGKREFNVEDGISINNYDSADVYGMKAQPSTCGYVPSGNSGKTWIWIVTAMLVVCLVVGIFLVFALLPENDDASENKDSGKTDVTVETAPQGEVEDMFEPESSSLIVEVVENDDSGTNENISDETDVPETEESEEAEEAEKDGEDEDAEKDGEDEDAETESEKEKKDRDELEKKEVREEVDGEEERKDNSSENITDIRQDKT